MPKANRPRVTLACPADVHHGPGERIIEFSFPEGAGGLISFGQTAVGPTVTVYRTDEPIRVGYAPSDGHRLSMGRTAGGGIMLSQRRRPLRAALKGGS